MLQPTSKHLTRPFLRALLENRCISPSGLEYSVEEVTELLIEKDTKLALNDFKNDLDYQVEQYNAENMTNHWGVIKQFQEASFYKLKLGIDKGREISCQEITPRVEKDTGIIFPLIVSNSRDVIPSQTTVRGESKRMKMKGYEITEREAIEAVDRAGAWLMQEISRLNDEIDRYGSKKVRGKSSKKR